MRFSLFDSDETMGDAEQFDPTGRYLRDVVIRLDGYYQSPTFDAANAAGMKAVLERAGWIIDKIGNETSSWFPQASGGFSYRIFGIVATNYTDAQILANIKRDLSGFFTTTRASITSPPWRPPSGVQNQPNLPPPVYGTQEPAAKPPPKDDPNDPNSAWNLFWKALGFTIAPTIGTVAIVAGVAAFVYLRRD